MEKDVRYPYMTPRQGTRNLMYRRPIPSELQKFFGGRPEFTQTLRTPDKDQAVPLYLKLAAHYEDELRKARQGLPTGTEYDTLRRKRSRLFNKAKRDPAQYLNHDVEWSEWGQDQQGRPVLHEIMEPETTSVEEAFLVQENRRLHDEIEQLQQSKALGIEDPRVMNVQIDARQHILHGTVPDSEPSAATGPLFSKVVAKYLAERKKGGKIKPRGLLKIERDIRDFREKIGDRPIDGYTKKDGRKYFEYLQNKPARGKRGQRLNPTTINANIGYVSKFFRWAIPRYDEDIINPLEGFRLEKAKTTRKNKKRLPLTTAELEKMVTLLDPKSAIYWPTLIAMYTGMREGEIIQLLKADIRTEGGILYFDVHEDSESLKNEASIKQVPVHKTLLQLGFENFVTQTNTAQLFPAIAYGPHWSKKSKNDNWARKFYRRWVYFMEKHHLKHPQLDFHSLRGNFSDACRNNGVPEFIWGWLQGRAEKGSVGDYGIGPNMKTKKTEIDKISYGLSIES